MSAYNEFKAIHAKVELHTDTSAQIQNRRSRQQAGSDISLCVSAFHDDCRTLTRSPAAKAENTHPNELDLNNKFRNNILYVGTVF